MFRSLPGTNRQPPPSPSQSHSFVLLSPSPLLSVSPSTLPRSLQRTSVYLLAPFTPKTAPETRFVPRTDNIDNMKTMQEQVGGRPLSAVTPEKRVEAACRTHMDGMGSARAAGASPQVSMARIIEVTFRSATFLPSATLDPLTNFKFPCACVVVSKLNYHSCCLEAQLVLDCRVAKSKAPPPLPPVPLCPNG